jgi:hypothetical protein
MLPIYSFRTVALRFYILVFDHNGQKGKDSSVATGHFPTDDLVLA